MSFGFVVSDSGLLVTHVLFAYIFWLLGKSWVESKVMAMELTVEVGRANFRWKRNSLMVMVGSRTPNRQQRSYAGNIVAMNDRTNVSNLSH